MKLNGLGFAVLKLPYRTLAEVPKSFKIALNFANLGFVVGLRSCAAALRDFEEAGATQRQTIL